MGNYINDRLLECAEAIKFCCDCYDSCTDCVFYDPDESKPYCVLIQSNPSEWNLKEDKNGKT